MLVSATEMLKVKFHDVQIELQQLSSELSSILMV